MSKRIHSREAFTLLELMVVLVLVSIMMAVSVPRFRNAIVSDPLKRSARQIIGTIKEARQRAAQSPRGCGLVIKIDDGEFGIFCPDPRSENDAENEAGADIRTDADEFDGADEGGATVHLLNIPESSRIKSIWNSESTRFTTGEVILWINADGQMEPSVINISDGGDEIGLTVYPFISDIRVDEEAVTPENYSGSEALL